jgi:hypothetical protein
LTTRALRFKRVYLRSVATYQAPQFLRRQELGVRVRFIGVDKSCKHAKGAGVKNYFEAQFLRRQKFGVRVRFTRVNESCKRAKGAGVKKYLKDKTREKTKNCL